MNQIPEEDSTSMMLSLSHSNSFYEEQLQKVTSKLKQFEAKLKNKTLKFSGYEDLNNLYAQKSETKEMSNEVKKVEFFYKYQ